jgi:ethanolamine utilization protein EutQ (cupin superfamily)
MGTLRVESRERTVDVSAGQAVIVPKGKWVRYSTPEVTEYIAVCHPAFAPKLMNRDRE